MARDWNGEVGLAVPGQFKVARDEALKAAAMRLFQSGYRALLKDAYDLDPNKPAAERVRSGFELLGPKVSQEVRAVFAWVQRLHLEQSGTLSEAWAEDLDKWRKRYDALRAQVLKAGGRTKSEPGENLYRPPAEGESWQSWLKGVTTGAEAMLVPLMIGAALMWWVRQRR